MISRARIASGVVLLLSFAPATVVAKDGKTAVTANGNVGAGGSKQCAFRDTHHIARHCTELTPMQLNSPCKCRIGTTIFTGHIV